MNPSAMSEISRSMLETEFGGEAQIAQPSQGLADRFEQLMAHAQPSAHSGSSVHETTLGKVIAAQDAQYQNVPNDMLYMMQHAQIPPGESLTETMDRITNQSVYIMMETAQMNADMNVKMAVVQSTQGSFESLMKNQ